MPVDEIDMFRAIPAPFSISGQFGKDHLSSVKRTQYYLKNLLYALTNKITHYIYTFKH